MNGSLLLTKLIQIAFLMFYNLDVLIWMENCI